jgi:D-amino-acid oxidase
MMDEGRRAVVIGAGVSGLTSALRLAEAGWRVRVWTADAPRRTISAVAAAIWYPYRVGPAGRVRSWGAASYREFLRLRGEDGAGVRLLPGLELLGPGADLRQFPDWAADIPDFSVATPSQLPPGRVGWSFSVPVIDTSVYLAWLEVRLAARGVRLEPRRVAALEEGLAAAELVVNCTGLASRELVPDAALRPVRGQVVRVENPGLTRFWLDEHHPEGLLYIVPRSGDCILGGTAEEDEEDCTPDPDTAQGIVRRCAELEPALAGCRIFEHRVGLRPGRPTVRLEAEDRGGGRIIHNYGHGGAGVTLSWGCADAVVALAT